MDSDTEILIDIIKTRIQGNIRIYKGIPFIHGVPAIQAEEPPILDCFAPWRCPHCNSLLSKDGFICLNGCHLSAPALRKFQDQIKSIYSKHEMYRGWINSLDYFSTFPGNFSDYNSLKRIEFDNDWEENRDFLRNTKWEGYVGLCRKLNFCLFSNANDAMRFRLKLA